MKKLLRAFIAASCISGALAQPAPPIVVGDLIQVTTYPDGCIPYQKGYQLALKEVNDAGGVLGRPVKVLFRDSGPGPESAVRVAEELIARDKVALLTGTCFDNVGLAVSNLSKRHKILFLKGYNGTNRHIWQEGHRYAFRFDCANYVYANALAEEAAQLPAKRWAFVAPNYEFGHSAVADFKAGLKKRRPDVEFVADQWPKVLQMDAAPTIQALLRAKPDAIFTACFGSDSTQLVREGRKRGLYDNRPMVSVLSGFPENLEPLKDEAPQGWIVLGYPYDEIKTPAHQKFVADYRAAYGEDPRYGAFIGYHVMKTVAAAITKAGVVETEKLVDAMEGLTIDSLIGPVTYRASDHQSTLGVWIGKTTIVNGKPTLRDWVYKPGDAYMPSAEEVKKLRPQ